MTKTSVSKFALRHIQCNEIAFFFKAQPVKGAPVHTTDVYYSDALYQPIDGTRMICGHCDGYIIPGNLSDEYLVEL